MIAPGRFRASTNTKPTYAASARYLRTIRTGPVTDLRTSEETLPKARRATALALP